MSAELLLVLDTATSAPVAALARADGSLIGAWQWTSRHRHGEELLTRVDELLAEASVERRALAGVIVGTGPGSFTGLRIGLATAKTICYALAIRLVGISSTRALALAAARAEPGLATVSVSLAAGAADRYVHRFRIDEGLPTELEPAQLVASPADTADLDGERIEGLAAALALLGAGALAAGEADDPAALVPAYVALPRGIAQAALEMTWSPDLR